MEIDESAPTPCSSCGAVVARGDMFGVEPELLCEACAEGVRKRMHVRFRPLDKDFVPRATAACLAIAVALFIASNLIWPLRPDTTQPGWLAALYQSWDIWLGHIWKHLTSMFLHGGFLHLIMNAGAMLWLGRPIEQRFGTPVFVGLLLATGVGGAAAEWIMSTRGAVGLSGAIFGFAGFLMARRRFDGVAAQLMDERAIRMVLGWGLLCIVLTITKIMPIANWAHGVGLGIGWLIGWASGQPMRKLLVPAATSVALLLAIASIYVTVGTTTVTYDNGKTWVDRPTSEVRARWLQEKP